MRGGCRSRERRTGAAPTPGVLTIEGVRSRSYLTAGRTIVNASAEPGGRSSYEAASPRADGTSRAPPASVARSPAARTRPAPRSPNDRAPAGSPGALQRRLAQARGRAQGRPIARFVIGTQSRSVLLETTWRWVQRVQTLLPFPVRAGKVEREGSFLHLLHPVSRAGRPLSAQPGRLRRFPGAGWEGARLHLKVCTLAGKSVPSRLP